MNRCFELAQLGRSTAHPNPMVGCVIVYDGKIIGEGYHTGFGKPHAEVEAIRSVNDKSLLQHSTLYVNLEPCAHHGKTPPCANLIIENKIPNVVISNVDPHEKVAGKGIKLLESAGIQVKTGVLSEKGSNLNKNFFTFHQKKRPYIVLKWAQTSDGYMGRSAGDSSMNKAISNDFSNQLVHELRANSDAILVGTNTAIVDNPALTTRLVPGRNPLRVAIDLRRRIPKSHKLYDGSASTLIIGPSQEAVSAEFANPPANADIWPFILETLFERNVVQLLVEGGNNVLTQLIEANLWDEAIIITGDQKWKNGIKAPILSITEATRTFSLSTDTIHIINNK